MPVAAGFVKREKGDSIISSLDKNYIIYAEPTTPKTSGVYLGLVFLQGMTESKIDTYEIINPVTNKKERQTHVLGVTAQQPNIPVTYYTGYGWSEFGFPVLSDFERYIQTFSEGLKHPLIIKYN